MHAAALLLQLQCQESLPECEFAASWCSVCMCVNAGERMYAHGGIVAAAAAILADMEQHNLLRRLLEEYDPFDQQRQQPSHRSDNPESEGGGGGEGGPLPALGGHEEGRRGGGVDPASTVAACLRDTKCRWSVHILYNRLQGLMHAYFTCTPPDAIVGFISPGCLC